MGRNLAVLRLTRTLDRGRPGMSVYVAAWLDRARSLAGHRTTVSVLQQINVPRSSEIGRQVRMMAICVGRWVVLQS